MPPPTLVKDEEPRNWSELPPELTSSIMLRLSLEEILENAQKVCSAWRRISKDPSLWRKIDMRGIHISKFGNLCRNAVDRSEGGLVDINIGNIGSDSLLDYIADRSINLRSLSLGMYFGAYSRMTNSGLVNALAKLPLLEVLQVSCIREKLDLKAIGHSCPKLKTLNLNFSGSRVSLSAHDDDDDALEIGETMPELCHLQIFGNTLTNTGLIAILDGCPHLQHLDLRRCFNIELVGDLEKRCFERIQDLRRPNDSIDDYSFRDFLSDVDSEEKEEEYEYEDDDYSIDSDEYVYHIFGDFFDHYAK
ncbi:hypothetical protein AALP_AAs56901U000700 [Arabis alpina]|uniref:F-box domain-containing protein n=1 Tax=Arabis alpina TaxID=50452 RepID=A0A087FWD7_ARAAL|nr:hypothetical protein AALP_AAs56901U000700 [Arabis alpina]